MIYDYKAACISRIGKVRNDNEDNFCFDGKTLPLENKGLSEALYSEGTTKNAVVFAVFDGMGGELGGEIAAFTAAKAFLKKAEALFERAERPRIFLKTALLEMNENVNKKSAEHKFSRSGTTAAILHVLLDKIYISNLGDSRIYRYNEGSIEQLSEDDVIFNPNIKNQCLTQFLGIDTDQYSINPHIKKGDISKGDIFMICSDGLYNAVSEDEICEIIESEKKDLAKCVEKLADMAEKNCGDDNCTVILVEFSKKSFFERLFCG